MRRLVPALVLVVTALGADLDDIRATQQRLVAARNSDKLPRDEVPLADVGDAKRQLLAWAESRLQSSGSKIDPSALTESLGTELHNAIKAGVDDDLDRLGDLDVEFVRPNGVPTWLQMNTDVGIPCGADRSVYLYEWRDNRWNRRFSLEARSDSRATYEPQNFVELQVSPEDRQGGQLVLATGYPPACMSVWHTLYIRLFRVDVTQTLLFERTPTANQGVEYSARLEQDGILINFASFSIDTDYLVRPYVWRYKIDHDNFQRIEPIALSPRDFVEEWLTNPWMEITAWSDPGLAESHSKLHKDHVFGSYDAVRRCATPGEWQISIDLDGKISYLSVLDRGDNRFKMLSISERPRTDCSGRNELER